MTETIRPKADPPFAEPAVEARLGLTKTGGFAIYAHCQTSIIPEFRSFFPDDYAYEGTRAVHLASASEFDSDRLSLLIRSALTYHHRDGPSRHLSATLPFVPARNTQRI